MRSRILYAVVMCGLTYIAAPVALLQAAPRPADDSNTIVLVFKDGRRQTFSMADIARIEFNAPASTAALSERSRFVGEWKVGDGSGRTFLITLTRDGDATKTLGARHGTWTVVNGEAQISWEDGWHDVIRREGGAYQKKAFAPGRPLSDEPSNVADAQPMMPN